MSTYHPSTRPRGIGSRLQTMTQSSTADASVKRSMSSMAVEMFGSAAVTIRWKRGMKPKLTLAVTTSSAPAHARDAALVVGASVTAAAPRPAAELS